MKSNNFYRLHKNQRKSIMRKNDVQNNSCLITNKKPMVLALLVTFQFPNFRVRKKLRKENMVVILPINRPSQFLLLLSWHYLGTMPFPLSKGSNSGGKVEPLKVIFSVKLLRSSHTYNFQKFHFAC